MTDNKHLEFARKLHEFLKQEGYNGGYMLLLELPESPEGTDFRRLFLQTYRRICGKL